MNTINGIVIYGVKANNDKYHIPMHILKLYNLNIFYREASYNYYYDLYYGAYIDLYSLLNTDISDYINDIQKNITKLIDFMSKEYNIILEDVNPNFYTAVHSNITLFSDYVPYNLKK